MHNYAVAISTLPGLERIDELYMCSILNSHKQTGNNEKKGACAEDSIRTLDNLWHVSRKIAIAYGRSLSLVIQCRLNNVPWSQGARTFIQSIPTIDSNELLFILSHFVFKFILRISKENKNMSIRIVIIYWH